MDDATKAIFVAAGERRKQLGIRLKRICLMADATQVEAFNSIYDGWVQRWGKEDAMDFLIAELCDAEVKLREWERVQRSRNEKARRGAKVSQTRKTGTTEKASAVAAPH